jgi:hypothetical protein
MLELRKNGVDQAIVWPLYDIYGQLNVCLCIPNAEPTRKIPVKKGIKQGTISSPKLFINSISEAQFKVTTSCILRGIDVIEAMWKPWTVILYGACVSEPSQRTK